jgi:hypothetical protein
MVVWTSKIICELLLQGQMTYLSLHGERVKTFWGILKYFFLKCNGIK